MARIARDACAKAGVDAIVVSYTILDVESVGERILGTHSPEACLDSWLQIVDKEGFPVIQARFYSDRVEVDSDDPASFARLLEVYDTWMRKLFLDIQSKATPEKGVDA